MLGSLPYRNALADCPGDRRTNRQIARKLHITSKTVDTHRTHLMRKLGIHDQTSLIKYSLRRGIIPLE